LAVAEARGTASLLGAARRTLAADNDDASVG